MVLTLLVAAKYARYLTPTAPRGGANGAERRHLLAPSTPTMSRIMAVGLLVLLSSCQAFQFATRSTSLAKPSRRASVVTAGPLDGIIKGIADKFSENEKGFGLLK